MQIILGVLAALAGYLIGSIPSGWVIVKILTGKDIRAIGSGRVGGTNAMRAAGLLAGALTAALDILKGIGAGALAGLLVPGDPWVRLVAVCFTVWGQIHSIFLAERTENGKLRLRGGAGGATALGGAIALWPQAWMVILPIGVFVYIVVGYASVTTISVAFVSLVTLGYRAVTGEGPWAYSLYGVFALVAVLYALQPNLERLRNGTERSVGLRALREKQAALKARISKSARRPGHKKTTKSSASA